MTMWSITVLLSVATLACFADAATVDCPTPTSPENGQVFLVGNGMSVKYACNPGYDLKGEVFSYCKDKEWTSVPPLCVPIDDSAELPSNKDTEERATYSRPLFSWDPENDNDTSNNGSGMVQDEPRVHMVLYPERRRPQARPVRIRTAAVRVQSATELEEEQRKRSQEEKPKPTVAPPSVIYVRKALTPGKVVVQDDTLRRQYELAALHLVGDPEPGVAAVVPVPRAAVSTDDKGGQSDEALRQMYIMAQDYMYPRRAVVDPNRSPMVYTLSESQIMWINSLHPELRERYLKDLYNTRAKEAEEGARAQEFLRRYEDAYHVLYNRPYYVRQPLAVMVEDPVASYDYTCYQADASGRATLIRPPRIPNARVTFYRRQNRNSPHNDYLSAVYKCNPGYRMRDNRFDELHCSHRAWYGERPICDRIATSPRGKSCLVNNGGCEQRCISHANGAFEKCGCEEGYRLAPDLISCVKIVTTPTDWRNGQSTSKKCSENNGGCEQICLSYPNGVFERCGCNRFFLIASDGTSCLSTRRSCSVNKGGCEQTCSTYSNSVQCGCREGFSLREDGRTCGDINECARGNFGCSDRCVNTLGSAYCLCHRGNTLSPDGKTCQANVQRSCSINNGDCAQVCSTYANSVECGCRKGFSLRADGRTCADINECAQDNFGCSHICMNVRGSSHCRCPRGFALSPDRKTCQDVDECASERTNRCHHKCTNTAGSYVCSCLPGYLMLKNNTCIGCPKNSYMTELGSCEECPPNSHTVAEGKTSLEDCTCESGYVGNPGQGIACTDIDECQVENFNCSGDCINTPGSAHCFCPVGYELDSDQKTCIDIDECAIKNGGCQITCHNTVGSFSCSCPEGYVSSTVDAYSCIDVDECLDRNGNCSHICNNFPGGFYCSCDDGYRLDASQKVCTAVTCSQFAVPHHATLRCGPTGGKRNDVSPTMTEFPYGTTCTFKCAKGFKLSSPKDVITCDKDGLWEGKKSVCVSLQCPQIEDPLNGKVEPASCSALGGQVLEKCYFTCKPGFVLHGSPVFTCMRSLSWHPKEFPTCKPVKVLPHVTCLHDVTVELPIGTNSTEVDILPPTGNVDAQYITTSPGWVKNGKVTFPAGTTDIVYTARSPTAPNVTSTCTRTVKIIDKEAPTVVECPAPLFVELATDTDDATLITWEEPVFEDNVAVVSITKTLEPNVSLSPGVHFVKYTAKDAEGNIADCVFHINVTDDGCKDPIGPVNGDSNCMDWMHGKFCEPYCEPDHVFYFPELSFYTCDSSGEWLPSDKIQDCMRFIPATNSECLPGMELKTDELAGEEICVECPSHMPWSNATKTCSEIDTTVENKDFLGEIPS